MAPQRSAIPSRCAIRWAAALVATLLPAAADAGDLERTVPVVAGERLVLHLDRGDVVVRSRGNGADARGPGAADVRLEARWSGFGSTAVHFHAQRRDGEVRLDGRADDWVGVLRGGPRVRVHAFVPSGIPVRIETADGSVDVAGVDGDVAARAVGGPVSVCDVAGSVTVETPDASVRVEDVRGDLRVRADAGRVEVQDVTGTVEVESGGAIQVFRARGAVRALARHGVIDLDGVAGEVTALAEDGSVWMRLVSAPRGSVRAQGGGIHVALPQRARGVIDARSAGGRVEVAPGLGLVAGRDASEVRGAVGGGGGLLQLRALGGSILIR